MSLILKDFWKIKPSVTVCMIIEMVLFPMLIYFNIDNILEKSFGMILLIVLFFMLAVMEFFGIWSLALKFIFTPLRLKKQFASLSESDKNAIISEYPTAKRVGNNIYLKDWLLILQQERMFLIRYSDISKIKKHHTALKITAAGYKKPILVGFPENGANAVTAAYIKSKNPKIKFSERTNQE